MARLKEYEVLYNLTPESIPIHITEERQYLRQIQSDIDIHREEHLIKRSLEAHTAACTEVSQTLIDEHKEQVKILQDTRRRDKQARAWTKIAYATNTFTPIGVVRLDILVGFATTDVKRMWEKLQNP